MDEKTQAPAPQGKSRALTVCAVCLAAAVIVAVAAALAVRGDGAVAYFDDQKITNTELSYFFWSEYFNLMGTSRADGAAVPDPETPLDQQLYAGTMTWRDRLLDLALVTVKDTMTMAAEAEKAGFTMPQDYKASYEDTLENFRRCAVDGGFTKKDGSCDLDAYLRDSYGAAADEATFTAYLYRSFLTAAYSDALYAAPQLSDEEISVYAAEHRADYDADLTDAQLRDAAESDLRYERYRSAFQGMVDSHTFRVDRAKVALSTPKGLYQTK